MRGEQPAIVVLGAGYAGLAFCRALAPRLADPSEILLVDRSPAHQLVVQLHEVAAFSTTAERLRVPFDRVAGMVGRLQANVERIDLAARRITTSAGTIPYRWLVIALGSEVRSDVVPGARDHAFTLRWVEDAERLRAHLETLAQRQHGASPAERPAWQTIVIGGGGATGVQLAGELADWLATDSGSVPGGRIMLIEALDSVLSRFAPRLGRTALEILRSKRVDVRLGQSIAGIDANGVRLPDGTRIDSRTVVWAGGIRPPDPVAPLAGATGILATDRTLRLDDHPEVFVVGDCLRVDTASGPLPASAQLAVQAGESAADNVARLLTRQPLLPFRPSYRGEAISLGRRNAVARVGRAILSGFAGYAIKQYTEESYVRSIGGMELLREWQG